ncbi:MAG: LPD38 domain-containing protein, partial [Lysinibacillus sp.]
KQNDNNSEKKEVEKDGSQENNKEGKISDVPVSDTVDNTVPLTTEVLGITGKAYTEVGTEIQFRYEVVGASQLIASHDTALRANEEYPSELQPRDRSRQASQQQIKTIAQKLNPELLADSAKASDGAPIVSSDYIVESGNGRTIAIQKMYQEKYATGVKYKSYLVENAEKFGLDAEKVKAMDNPVLVRVRTNEVNRQEFVEEANVSNVAAMSSVEQAVADSKKLTDKVMYLFSPSEQGDLNVASNQAFISQFIQSVVPNNERGILMTSDGALSQDGLRRVQNAILAKAYGNSEALMLMVESNDNNVKTLTNTLLQAAPSVVKMVDGIQNNAYYNEDISKDLVAAVEKFSELRSENTSVETFLNQTSLFDDGLSNVSKELLRLFDTGVVIDGKARKSVKAYKELIDTYVEVLQAAGNPNQQSLFKDAAPTKDELLVAAIQKVSNEDAGVQTNLFEDESESSQSTTETSGRKTSSNTDTFVRARGERNQAEVNKGETTRAEIISFIKENFNVRIDVGQYRQRAKGIFKNKFAIVRTKEYGDFEVIAHELGHRFDIKNGWSSDPTLKQEWIKFAEANLELPRDMTQVKKAKEGVAEYFRQYLYAETNAPVSYTELSQTLHDKVNASMKKAKWDKPLAATRAKMIDWLNRDAEQELRGVVAPIGQQKIRLTAKQFITKYYTKIFEKEHPIFDAIKKIEKELGIKIEGRSNAYQMAVLTRGTVARAATFIKRETFNSLTGERTGESLESILKDVDDVESFGRYLVARHGLYLIKKQGKSKTPLSPELMEEYLENGKHYEEHADRIYRYQNELLKVLVDGNLIPKDLPEALREKYPYYVPFYRVMTETGEKTSNGGGGGNSQQYVNQQQGVKRMSEQGSARNIVNPIESIIRNTHLYFGLADRNAAGFAMSELADPEGEFAAEVTRDIIEEIPNKMKLYEGQLEQIKGTLINAGITEDTLNEMDMEETFKVFEPMFRPNSANNEILVWKEGKPSLYKIHDTLLYNSLIAYDSRALSEAMGLFFKPLEASNNLLRSGITASPYFTIRTFWRSLAQVFVKTEAQGFNYVTHPFRVIKAISSVAESRFKNNDAVTEWWKSGGAQSTFIAVENEYLDKELKKVTLNKRARNYLRSMKQGTKAERRALNWYLLKTATTSPFHILQTFNDTLDQGIKLAEYQAVKKQTGSRQLAALASREADVDYKRFGSSVREFNKLALFFNVSLQGPDNLARTFAKFPVRTSIRALTLLTLPTLFLYALNRDDEEYQELDSWEKDMNWMVPMGDGVFAKIPVPFELGVMFKTIPEKMYGEFLDAARDENKQNFDKFYGNALSTMHPTLMPTLANVWYSYLTEKSLNFNRDFVPRSLQGMEKADQYGENTSEIMKFIASKSRGKNLLGINLEQSPIVLEETFKAQFGQMGQFYLWSADKLLLNTGAVEKTDTKGLKRGYTERYVTSSINDGGTDSTTKFYEVLDKKERHYKSFGLPYSVPDDLKMYRQVSKDMSTLRKLRDEMMYNKMLDANGQPFSKDIKKDHIDTINKALRDMSRYARLAGEDDDVTQEELANAYEKGVMDKENFNRALEMLGNFEAYQKARDKEARSKAKEQKQEREIKKLQEN